MLSRPPTSPLFPYTTLFRSLHAVADAPHESAPHADQASRRGVAQAPAHGGGPAPGVGLDPARDPGDDGTLPVARTGDPIDRKSTRLNSSHVSISYAVFCLKK